MRGTVTRFIIAVVLVLLTLWLTARIGPSRVDTSPLPADKAVLVCPGEDPCGAPDPATLRRWT